MKKIFYLMLVVIFLSSCNNSQPQPTPQKVTTTVIAEKVTYSNQGFYVEQQFIVKGNTVWGISEKVYGTGLQWRDIIALNPFLNTPDRLYYNPDRKMWIVRIYPGEVLNIGGQKVYPSCTYERTTTTTTTEPIPASTSIIPWWEWVLVVIAIVALLLGLIRLLWPGFASSFSSSTSNASAAIHVDLSQPGGIDVAVQRAILENRQSLRQGIANAITDGAKNGSLKDFYVVESEDVFIASGSFRRDCRQTTEPKKEA